MSFAALFGRADELASADAFLEAAEHQFAVLRLQGEPGIGKTAVWHEVVRRARARDFRVLSCRPAETETRFALSALADLLELVESDQYAALPPPQRHALEVALLRVDPRGSGPDPRALATAVRSLLVNVSAGGQLLVAIDDAQWLDHDTAGILQFVLRRLAGTRMGWLIAGRPSEPDWAADGGLVAVEAQTLVRLGPLALPAIHQMLRHRMRESLSRPVLRRVYQMSAGNPLLALEVMRTLDAPVPSVGAPPGLSYGLREVLAGRIPELSPAARAALLSAAALSHPTVELVEQASSAAALAAAEETGLVRVEAGRVAFTHPLYASVVYGAAARLERRELHLRLAGLVSDAEERARHLARATSRPDEDVAQTLEDGAGLARSRGAWESAADLFERAYALTPAGPRSAQLRRGITAAECRVRAGERARARELLADILAHALTPPLRSEALRLLAEISYSDEHVAESRRLFEEALRYADNPRQVIAIELGLSALSGQLADPGAGARHASRALAQAEAVGDKPLLASALALSTMYDYLTGRGVSWEKMQRALALEAGDPIMPLFLHPDVINALLLLYVGRHAEARDGLAGVWSAARDRGDESDLAFIGLWRSWLESRSGDFTAALALAEEAMALASLTGSESTQWHLVAQRALTHAYRGDTAAALRDCAEAATRLDVPWVAVWVAAARGTLELARGDPRAAWAACEAVTAAIERDGLGEPVTAIFLPDAIEALVATGALDRAERLADALEARGRELDRAWALATGGRCRALLRAARGDLPGARQALDGALAQHDRLDLPLERARTLIVGGGIERRARRPARARALLEQAHATCERTGAALWAQRSQQELGKLTARRSPGGELTDAERRVAQASARGLTNREVAAALFLSPKTVEAHLSRIYRKLGIDSRAALGAYMADRSTG
jgi:DNA-binding CsgD family transcriptional regulator